MMAIIHSSNPDFDPIEVKAFIESQDAEGTRQAREMIDEINRIIFDDVISKLKDKYGTLKDSWWVNGVSKNVRNECDKQFNESDGERERWRYLYLINYLEIVLYQDNWELFKDQYNFYGKGKKADLVRWIIRLNKCRQVTHHAEKGPLSRNEVAFVRRVHELVKEHIEEDTPVEPNYRYLSD